jgi:predicted nuclease with TOPRIM domain
MANRKINRGGKKDMKKMMLVLFLTLLTMSFLIIGCGGKYSEAEKMNKEYIALLEDYVADIDKADNAKNVAKAMNRFADGMEELMPKIRKLSEKYPELKDRSNPPEELKETQKKAEEIGQKMAGSMIKLMPYMMAPEVLNAQKRLAAAMMNQ